MIWRHVWVHVMTMIRDRHLHIHTVRVRGVDRLRVQLLLWRPRRTGDFTNKWEKVRRSEALSDERESCNPSLSDWFISISGGTSSSVLLSVRTKCKCAPLMKLQYVKMKQFILVYMYVDLHVCVCCCSQVQSTAWMPQQQYVMQPTVSDLWPFFSVWPFTLH